MKRIEKKKILQSFLILGTIISGAIYFASGDETNGEELAELSLGDSGSSESSTTDVKFPLRQIEHEDTDSELSQKEDDGLTLLAAYMLGDSTSQLGIENAEGESIAAGLFSNGVFLDMPNKRVGVQHSSDSSLNFSESLSEDEMPISICSENASDDFYVLVKKNQKLSLDKYQRSPLSLISAQTLQGLPATFVHSVGAIQCSFHFGKFYFDNGLEIFELDPRNTNVQKVPGYPYQGNKDEFIVVTGNSESRRIQIVDRQAKLRLEFNINPEFSSIVSVFSDSDRSIFVAYKEYLESEISEGIVGTLYWIVEKYDEKGTKIGQVMIDDPAEVTVDKPFSIDSNGKVQFIGVKGKTLQLSQLKI